MPDLDGMTELLMSIDPREGNKPALTIAEQKRAGWLDREASKSLAVLEAQVRYDSVQTAIHFHKTRSIFERIGGTLVSVPMGFLSGVIAAVLDGTATGISLVAPVAVPALIMMAASLIVQTVQLAEPFNWTVAGRMIVYASWRSLIVLFLTLTITGAIMWYNNRVNGEMAESIRGSYEAQP